MTLHTGDCLEVMRGMADNSVDAIVTDPPYYRVKDCAWDKQWDTREGFIDWVHTLCEQWQRILRPNGSLFCFASPQMRAHVEVAVSRWFNTLPTITWRKERGRYKAVCKEDMRSFVPCTEAIIFAEHYGADNMAKGEAGYVAKCDELRGFVFEPLRAYLAGERDRAGCTTRKVAEQFQKKTGSRTVTGMAGHWFERVQWVLPTAPNYQWLRSLFNATGGDYLRREYEELRRPFAVTENMQYTDVWDFEPVQAYQGKHPCEKPIPLLSHIITTSTREGATVLDCFMGTGSTGMACKIHGRDFIGIELNPDYVTLAQRRIAAATYQPDLFS
jgi:adenine-specific DNA-methyltransferase